MMTDAQKTADAEVKAEARAAVDRIKERAKAERETDSLRTKGTKSALKALDDELKAYEKVEKAKITQTQQWARQREIIQTNSAKLAWKLAEEEVKAAEMSARKSSTARERWARGLGGTTASSVGKVFNTATLLGGSMMALGGGFGIADAMSKQMSLEKSAALYSNMSTGDGTGQRIATKDVMNRARVVQGVTGVDATSVSEGMKAYFAKSGDAKGGMEQAMLFAKLSQASGADVKDIATVAGTMKFQNPGMDDKTMKNLLLGAVGQTRAGAVDFGALLGAAPQIMSTAGLYAGDQSQNQRKLIGLTQVAIGQTGDPSSAATTVSRFASDTIKSQDKLKAAGINPMDAKGNIIDPATLIGKVFDATKGDTKKIMDLGYDERSIKIFEAQRKNYQAGGSQAVVADIKKYTDAGYTDAGLESDFQNAQATSSAKFTKATNDISEMLQTKLTPYMEAFADKLPELMPKIGAAIDAFASIADFFLSNPITGIGAVIALQVGKDVAAAQIGEAIKSMLGGSAAGGGGGSALGLAVAGGVVITAAQAWIQAGTDEDKSRGQNISKDQMAAQNAIMALKGDASPANVEAAKKAMAKLQADEGQIGKKSSFGAVASWFGGGEEEGKRNAKLFGDLADSVTKLDTALKKASQTADNVTPAPNRKGPMTSPGRDGPP